MARRGQPEPWRKIKCGPIEPFNDRMRLKQLISDELIKLRGKNTSSDRAAIFLETRVRA